LGCSSTENNTTTQSSIENELDRSALIKKYPNLANSSVDNEKVLCPFVRILNKTGLFQQAQNDKAEELVSIATLTDAANEFGCSTIACGAVATAVSVGQKVAGSTDIGYVNIEKLHTAKGIAHQCGYTFAKNGTQVSDTARKRSLQMLKDKANADGHITLEDLKAVKKSICSEQNEDKTLAGSLEAELIYTFLGGESRGYIELADVDRFFHTQLPLTLGKPSRHFKD